MQNNNASENLRVGLDDYQISAKPKKKKINTKAEDAALELVGQVLPTNLRASERDFEEFYEQARILYNAGKLKEALSRFLILNTGNGRNPKYAFAVAASYHMMKEYKKAIEFYAATSILDSETPTPFYYSSDCFVKMHDPFGALIALDVGLKRPRNPKYTKFFERMESMAKKLENELEEKKRESTTSFIKPKQ